MKFFILFIAIIFLTIHASIASCDSTVVKVTKEKIDSGAWYIKEITAEIYTDGLLRKTSINPITSKPYEYKYTYDSLGRLFEEIRDSVYKYSSYYYLTGNDSALILSYFDGTNYSITYGAFYFYDSNNNLYQTFNETYNATQQSWDTTYYTNSSYSVDSLKRTDQSCPYNSPCIFPPITITVWDLLHRIINKTTYAQYQSFDTIRYDSTCTLNKKIEIYYYQAPQGRAESRVTEWDYDSICRPLKIYSASRSYGDINFERFTENETNYFYADCSHIVIVGDDSLVSCPDLPDTVSLYVFGGTGNYVYSWTPNDSISSDTILNPVLYSTISNTYHLSVLDSVGNSSNFQLNLIAYCDTICKNNCDTICVNNCDTINKNNVDSIYIFPNPAVNILFIKKSAHESLTKLNVFNSMGQIVKIEYATLNDETIEVNIYNLSQGLYFIELQTEKSNFLKKFMKNNEMK